MPADETVLASALAGRKRLAGSASLLLADVLAWLVGATVKGRVRATVAAGRLVYAA